MGGWFEGRRNREVGTALVTSCPAHCGLEQTILCLQNWAAPQASTLKLAFLLWRPGQAFLPHLTLYMPATLTLINPRTWVKGMWPPGWGYGALKGNPYLLVQVRLDRTSLTLPSPWDKGETPHLVKHITNYYPHSELGPYCQCKIHLANY